MGYQFRSRVRYSEIDEDGKLTLPAILNYFQDCCTFHSEDVGLGMKKLRKIHRLGFVILAEHCGALSRTWGRADSGNLAL